MSVTVEHVRDRLIPAACALTGIRDTPEARVLMLAIGLQESRFQHRRQIRGPARGFWQHEAGGGTAGVLRHEASRARALRVCQARGVVPVPSIVNEALATDDLLAACFARLLLFTDPRPLPRIGDAAGAWDYYIWNWRPGKPHRHTWGELYARAVAAVGAG